MGHEWLTQVKEALKNAGFRVEAGYPAQKAVHLTDTVAAVNLGAMEGSRIREVAVCILTPRVMGLEACQNRASDAVLALSKDGNQWRFDRWRYEAGIDCWAIEILGTPVQASGVLGYTIAIGQVQQGHVTDFLARQVQDRRLIRPHGDDTPSGVTPGRRGWTLKLTQLLPEGEAEPEEGTEPFSLTVSRGGVQQTYTGCCWAEYASQQLPEGIQIVRSAFALDREVSTDGQNAV